MPISAMSGLVLAKQHLSADRVSVCVFADHIRFSSVKAVALQACHTKIPQTVACSLSGILTEAPCERASGFDTFSLSLFPDLPYSGLSEASVVADRPHGFPLSRGANSDATPSLDSFRIKAFSLSLIPLPVVCTQPVSERLLLNAISR